MNESVKESVVKVDDGFYISRCALMGFRVDQGGLRPNRCGLLETRWSRVGSCGFGSLVIYTYIYITYIHTTHNHRKSIVSI
ncbi:hypothetical protein HanLR1_Chr02g0045881 [Helianthus annuus]|nr:hypothetical protein HanLR1_Chr02g0045881 [Helianthus annuus]